MEKLLNENENINDESKIFGELTKGGVRGSTFNLCCTAIGAGV